MDVKESNSLPTFKFTSHANQFLQLKSKSPITTEQNVDVWSILIILSENLDNSSQIYLEFWLGFIDITASKKYWFFPQFNLSNNTFCKSTQIITSNNRYVVFIKHTHSFFSGIWGMTWTQLIISWNINIRITSLNGRI